MSDGIGPRSLCPYCLTLPGEAHMHHCPRRMEQDYLRPVYPQPPFAARIAASSPSEECATATGVPVEVVRRVLSHVFGVDPTTPKGATDE